MRDQNYMANSTAAAKLANYLDALVRTNFDSSRLTTPYENLTSATVNYNILANELDNYGCPLMADFVRHPRFLVQKRYLVDQENGKINPSTLKNLKNIHDFLVKKFPDHNNHDTIIKAFRSKKSHV